MAREGDAEMRLCIEEVKGWGLSISWVDLASLGAQGPREHGTSDFSHRELSPFVEGDRESTVTLLTILVSALSVSDNNIISILSNLDN